MQNSYLFLSMLPFLKKKSGILSFRVNDILMSILSALHPFLTLPDDVLNRKRGTLVVEEGPVTPFLCGGIPLIFGGIH